jgi:hypothetical protein
VPFGAKPREVKKVKMVRDSNITRHKEQIFDFVLTSITISSPKGKESSDLAIDVDFLDITCLIKDLDIHLVNLSIGWWRPRDWYQKGSVNFLSILSEPKDLGSRGPVCAAERVDKSNLGERIRMTTLFVDIPRMDEISSGKLLLHNLLVEIDCSMVGHLSRRLVSNNPLERETSLSLRHPCTRRGAQLEDEESQEGRLEDHDASLVQLLNI